MDRSVDIALSAMKIAIWRSLLQDLPAVHEREAQAMLGVR
jgi:hypothetical protein